METITIDGTLYEVVSRETADQAEARGHVNVARYMRDVGSKAQTILKRPKGRTLYHIHEFENGRTTKPLSLGGVLRQNAKA